MLHVECAGSANFPTHSTPVSLLQSHFRSRVSNIPLCRNSCSSSWQQQEQIVMTVFILLAVLYSLRVKLKGLLKGISGHPPATYDTLKFLKRFLNLRTFFGATKII